MLAVLAAVAGVGAIFILASGVFLVAFAAILFAVVFYDASRFLAQRSPLSLRGALAVVFVGFLLLLIGLTWITAPNVIDQASQVTERVPRAIDAIDRWLAGWLGGDAQLQIRDLLPSTQSLLGNLPMIVSTTFGVLGSLVVVLALGVYLAARPQVYRDGVVRLFTRQRRDHVRAILDEIGEVLGRWLQGQLLAMVVVGLVSYGVLRLLGVPLALTLALITGLMELVPYIGAIAAAVPVVLVALTESLSLALYALLAYTAIQVIEGYLLIPLIQKRAIRVPPALIILAQVLLGVLFGVVGIVLATPLLAAVAVIVQRGYIQGVLERD